MESEIWKIIPAYPKYKISSHGRVKSYRKRKPCILKPWLVKGYYSLVLCNKDGQKKHYIHRLVAAAFVENPDNKLMVNHIDGVPTHNYYENLEWCTASENTQHALVNNLTGRTGSPRDRQCVRTTNIVTGEVYDHASLTAAARYLNLQTHTALSIQLNKGVRVCNRHVIDRIDTDIPYRAQSIPNPGIVGPTGIAVSVIILTHTVTGKITECLSFADTAKCLGTDDITIKNRIKARVPVYGDCHISRTRRPIKYNEQNIHNPNVIGSRVMITV